MAGPRGFVATSLGLIALEVVLTSDSGAFENLTGLLGLPARVAEAWLSPAVPTLGATALSSNGNTPTAGSRPAGDRPGFGTGTAQLTPDFHVVPVPQNVPAPQVAPTPKPS